MFLAMCLPLILAALGFAVGFGFLKTELSGIVGAFLGIASGVLIAVMLGKMHGTAKLPRVKKIL